MAHNAHAATPAHAASFVAQMLSSKRTGSDEADARQLEQEIEGGGPEASMDFSMAYVGVDGGAAAAAIADSAIGGLPAMMLSPIRTARDPAELGPHQRAQHAAAPYYGQPQYGQATPTTSASMACASPTTSCGSPMLSCVPAAPPSTPKRHTSDFLSESGAHAEDSLAKRVMKRAATASMTARHEAAAAGLAASSTPPVVSTGHFSPGIGSPHAADASSPLALPSRPVTTSMPGQYEAQAPALLQAQYSPVYGSPLAAAAAAAAAANPFAGGLSSGIPMSLMDALMAQAQPRMQSMPGHASAGQSSSSAAMFLPPMPMSSAAAPPRARDAAGAGAGASSRSGSPAVHSSSAQHLRYKISSDGLEHPSE